MALTCISGGRECDGCQECQEREVIETCIVCHEDIYCEDDYIDIEDGFIHADCLAEWEDSQ